MSIENVRGQVDAFDVVRWEGVPSLEALRELLLVVELPEVERIWLKHDFGCVLFEVFSLTDNSESCLSSCYATLAFPIVPGLCHDAGPRASPLRFRSGTARAWDGTTRVAGKRRRRQQQSTRRRTDLDLVMAGREEERADHRANLPLPEVGLLHQQMQR